MPEFKPFVLELVPYNSISQMSATHAKTDQNIHVSLSLYPVYKNKRYHLHH